MLTSMSRHPLIHFPGALFHITARGNNKQIIFRNPQDFNRYIANIKRVKEEIPFYLYAVTLMPNHVHLLVEIINSPINKIMQKLQTAYTMYANKKFETVGHLFQGRYLSILVEKESYLLELIRYIHLNPVRAMLVNDPVSYPWSSHQAYLGQKNKIAEIIDKTKILPYFSANPKKAVKNYNEFVLAGIYKRWEDFAPELKRNHILGSGKFTQTVERRMLKLG